MTLCVVLSSIDTFVDIPLGRAIHTEQVLELPDKPRVPLANLLFLGQAFQHQHRLIQLM